MKISFYFAAIILMCFAVEAVKRISERKCEDYKNIIAKFRTHGGLGIAKQTAIRKKSFKCSNDASGLIVGGQKAKLKEFPHMAAIGWVVDDGNLAFRCGGSLISENFVLTAAHCEFDDNGNWPAVVRVGARNLAASSNETNAAEYKIQSFIKHENFSSLNMENDIALIKLQENVKVDKQFVRPACLFSNHRTPKKVTATGWGKTSTHSETSDYLLKVQLQTVSNDDCYNEVGDNIYADEIDDSKICAGGVRNKDTCQGDSGGPIQISMRNIKCVYYIVGLTSYAWPKCGAEIPAIYTRVSFYIDWIEEIVWPENNLTDAEMN